MEDSYLRYDRIRVAVAQNQRYLPIGYILNDNDVYCGRGHLAITHVGNENFRMIVSANKHRYSDTRSKIEKTILIYEIVDYVRSLSPNGGFVKKNFEINRHYEVGDVIAVRIL